MSSSDALLPPLPTGGFSFENFQRNEYITQNFGIKMPKFQKTGTTIVGICFKDGIILGADTRATSGSIIADKNCSKIHYLAKNIYCCGAGTAADTEFTTKMISSQIELLRMNTSSQILVRTANRILTKYLYRYQGHIGAALVLGGVDKNGAHLYSIHPHGSTNKLPYTTMGSGSLAAMAIFETGWKPDIDLEEGKRLVKNAIRAGIFNDLGSGSNVDLCVITRNETKYFRNYEESCLKGERQGIYKFKPGITAIFSKKIIPLVLESSELFVRAIDDKSILSRNVEKDDEKASDKQHSTHATKR